MSEDDIDALIKAALARQWKSGHELCEEVHRSRNTSEKTLYRHLSRLQKSGEVEVTGRRTPEGNKEFIYRLSIKKRAKTIIETFHDICSRFPNSDEIALELSDGTLPEDAEKVAFETAKETGWRPPTAEEISQTRSRLGETLYAAALIKQKEQLPEKPVIDDQERRDANILLAKYPELIPEFDSGNKLIWSRKAEFYLGGQFTPTKRRFLVYTGK